MTRRNQDVLEQLPPVTRSLYLLAVSMRGAEVSESEQPEAA